MRRLSSFRGSAVSSHFFIPTTPFEIKGDAILCLQGKPHHIFGKSTLRSYFFHDAMCPVALHQKVRRDYPLEGDSSMSFWEEGTRADSRVLVEMSRKVKKTS